MSGAIGSPVLEAAAAEERAAHDTRIAEGRGPGSVFSRTIAPLALWASLIGVSAAWGGWLIEHRGPMFLNAPPLTGSWDPRFSARVLLAVAFGVAAWELVPRLAERAAWRWVLVGGFAAAAAWGALLAFGDGAFGLIRAPSSALDYLHDVPRVRSPGPFVSMFVERIEIYSAHVRAHPPGMVTLLWALDRVGLAGPWPVAALEILGGAAAVPAVLVACRDLAGERRARLAAPFVALAPVAVFAASSGDALFAGVGAWAVAAIVLATGRTDRRGDLLSVGGGLLFGAGILLSYGLVLVCVIPAMVAVSRRRARPLVLAVAGAGVVVAAFAVAGFWWGEGLFATRLQYLASGAARRRPYLHFLVANVAAFAIALGPAIAVGLARLRDRAVWLLVGGALLAALLADLSGMSKGEVERIWLPFAFWVLLASGAFVARAERRVWLGVQVAAGLALQMLVVSPW